MRKNFMNIGRIVRFAVIMTSFSSIHCATDTRTIKVIDNNLQPYKSRINIELTQNRGCYGMGVYADSNYYNQSEKIVQIKKFKYENGSKKWIIDNWGKPDHVEKYNGNFYYKYIKKDKAAPNYNRQFIFGEKEVKLQFDGDQLISIEAYFADLPWFKGRKIVVIDK
jgi:hypothetical protein